MILLLNLHDFVFGGFYELRLVTGDQHVVNADGDAGLGGVQEAKFLQLIEHQNRALNTVAQVNVVNELLHALLLQQAINERRAGRK